MFGGFKQALGSAAKGMQDMAAAGQQKAKEGYEKTKQVGIIFLYSSVMR